MAATEEPEYTLYYWPHAFGPGRAGFVRLMFEAAGVKFKEVNDFKLISELFKEQKIDGYPSFAPPLLRHGDLQLSQTPVICRYLGKQLGLLPESEADQWHAEQVNVTIHDFIADGRLAFHGKDFVASYFDQVEETKPYIERFIKTRLPKWLSHFEKALAFNANGTSYMVGDRLTYVDIGMLHALRATESQFPDAWNETNAIPLLKSYKKRLESLPKLEAYFKSDRVIPFSGNSMM